MRSGVPLKNIALAAALLGGAATVFAVSRDDQKVERVSELGAATKFENCPTPRRLATAKSSRSIEKGSSRLAREIRILRVREVIDQLPEGKLGNATERSDLLFQRLGALEGEEALDRILSRYGAGANSARAMALAITGWMELDSNKAIAAFSEFADVHNGNLFAQGLKWKGTCILSGLG